MPQINSYAFDELALLDFRTIAPLGRITASANTAAVDVSDYTGSGLFVLTTTATEGASQTADFKVQTSADGTTWVDAGISFAQVTNAAGGSLQPVIASTDGLKKYARVVATLTGTSPAVTYSLALVGKANP